MTGSTLGLSRAVRLSSPPIKGGDRNGMNDATSARPGDPTPAAQISGLDRARAILGGSAGNLVEWYDWFAYAAFSIYFAKVFFPEGDQTAQFMKTAAIFAVGFLARPVGAWLMGLYADRAGRRADIARGRMIVPIERCDGMILRIGEDNRTDDEC